MVKSEPRCADATRCGITEAAKKLGISRTTMSRWVHGGAVRVGMRRVGRHRLFITGKEIKRLWAAVM